MPNSTRATRVEGLERLRFSLARQNATASTTCCISSLACPCAPSHGQSDLLSRALAHPWTKRDERCCCSFAAHHAYTHTLLLLPHSLTLSLPLLPSALPSSLSPRPLPLLLRYHIHLSTHPHRSFAFFALPGTSPPTHGRALIRPRALLHTIPHRISTSSTASLSDFTCAGFCFDFGCLCLVVYRSSTLRPPLEELARSPPTTQACDQPHQLQTKSPSCLIPQRCISRQSNSIASAPGPATASSKNTLF